MNFSKRFSAACAAAAAAAVLVCGTALHASATGSVEDVYDAMRRIGLPESMIQDAKVQYQNIPHDADGMSINGTYYTYSVWADMVDIYQDDIWNEVAGEYGLSGEQVRKSYETATQPVAGKTAETTCITTTLPSVTTNKPFVSMTREEKQTYIASLPEEERVAFVAGLSTAERNSIIKQMDPQQKANIMHNYIALGDQFGMHITVDDISNGSISYSVRDEDGKLIDSNSLGADADETGWDLTRPILLATGCVLISVGGVIWLVSRMNRSNEDDDE